MDKPKGEDALWPQIEQSDVGCGLGLRRSSTKKAQELEEGGGRSCRGPVV